MPSPEIVEAITSEQLATVSELFLEYAKALDWDLSPGGRLIAEIHSPPGPYAPPAGALLLAYVDDAVAGIVGLQPVPTDVRLPAAGIETAGEIKRLFVRDGFRRHGVALALMQRAETEARLRGYDHLVLTTSERMFPLAQPLYDVLGYGPTEPYRSDMADFEGVRWLGKEL
jgi:putative acetyltransferase